MCTQARDYSDVTSIIVGFIQPVLTLHIYSPPGSGRLNKLRCKGQLQKFKELVDDKFVALQSLKWNKRDFVLALPHLQGAINVDTDVWDKQSGYFHLEMCSEGTGQATGQRYHFSDYPRSKNTIQRGSPLSLWTGLLLQPF